MADFDYDLGVIGGGAGGLTAAAGAARLGARTLLIEKEAALGGDCLHFGCVPSKTLIRSANVYHQMRHAERFGLPAVDPPPVDFARISARIRRVIGKIQEHDSVERFCGLGAAVMFGEPAFSDEHTVMLDGRRHTARNWVVATGSRAAVPPISGLNKTPYLTNREIFYLESLPESLIILGGGPIGVEMAQAFCRLGSRVTVVEMIPQILGPEDLDMADIIKERLREEGVTFYLNARATRVEDLGDARRVTLEKAGGEEVAITAEALLVALGRAPNIQGLGLEKIGIETGRRGIAVDRRLRTSHKHIFAVGDCNGGLQFTHVAGYEGGVALVNAVMRLPRKADYTWVPWCTYTDPELASVGMNEKRAAEAGIETKVLIEPFSGNDRSLAEEERTGLIKLVLDKSEKPLGVQICGPHAGEILSEWVAALSGGVKLSSLASAIHPYPTLSEINKRVAGKVFEPKLYSETVKKTLKLLFSLKGRACQPEE